MLKKIFRESYEGRVEFPKELKCPKPEDITELRFYAFTLNPKDQPFNLLRHADIVAFFDDVRLLISKMHGCELKLVVEASKKGRLHFHGLIGITNKMWFFFHDIHTLNNYGNFDIEPITEPFMWDLYIYKNRDMMSEWLTAVNCSHLGYYEHNSPLITETQL